MRFYTGPELRIGATRRKRGFAFFPKLIDRHLRVWLERYIRDEMWYQPMNRRMERFVPRWCPYDPAENLVYDKVEGRGWVNVMPTSPPGSSLRLTTGSISLDALIGEGGLPRGRVTEIHGLPLVHDPIIPQRGIGGAGGVGNAIHSTLLKSYFPKDKKIEKVVPEKHRLSRQEFMEKEMK